MFKHTMIIGWDVGGAHLKAAQLDASGELLRVVQVQCQLWLGLPQLEAAIDKVLAIFSLIQPAQHIVTMTGELADCFENRQHGVSEISACMTHRLGASILFYAVKTSSSLLTSESVFLPPDEVNANAKHIASFNWFASASLLAKRVPEALLIDIGSSTTDIVVLHEAQPMPLGLDDGQRMQVSELVYTGVVRTPLMAVASKLPFQGEWVEVAAEHFATMADVYRITGQLDGSYDMATTADGRDKSISASMTRIARMIGRDVQDANAQAWTQLAYAARQLQLTQIQTAVLRALSRNLLNQDAPIIAVGAGNFLAQHLATSLARPCLTLAHALNIESTQATQWASVCLPAYAVAALYIQNRL